MELIKRVTYKKNSYIKNQEKREFQIQKKIIFTHQNS